MSFLIEVNSVKRNFEKHENKVLIDNESLILSLWGYIVPSCEASLRDISVNNYKELLEGLDGEYSLVLEVKNENKVVIANGYTGQQPVYYTSKNNSIVISNSFDKLKDRISWGKLSTEASYQMLQYGFLLENLTPLEDVYKLFQREYLELDLGTGDLSILRFSSPKKFEVKCEDEAIKLIELSFNKSLDNLTSLIDKEALSPVFTLSGGLDSRVVALEMSERLPGNLRTLCFGKKGCLDMEISDNIARKYAFDHCFYELTANDYLYNFERSWRENNGFVYFSGASHTSSAINSIRMNKSNLLVTGQLGDAVLGSYLGESEAPPVVVKGLGRFGYSKEPIFYSYRPKYNYKNMEEYLMFNRGFNGINNGVVTINKYTSHFSPFLTKDFIESSMSIAPSIRKKLSFYLKWLEKYHQSSTEFKWERYELLPLLRNKYLIENKLYHKLLSVKRKVTNSGMISFDNEFKSYNGTELFDWNAAFEKLEDKALREQILKLKNKHGMLMDLKVYTVLFNATKYGN